MSQSLLYYLRAQHKFSHMMLIIKHLFCCYFGWHLLCRHTDNHKFHVVELKPYNGDYIWMNVSLFWGMWSQLESIFLPRLLQIFLLPLFLLYFLLVRFLPKVRPNDVFDSILHIIKKTYVALSGPQPSQCTCTKGTSSCVKFLDKALTILDRGAFRNATMSRKETLLLGYWKCGSL